MVRRSSARLSAKAASTTKTPSQSLTKQKTAAKPAKSRSSTATVAAAAAAAFDSSSDNDNGSDAPSTKRRRRNNGTASTIKKNNVAVIENAASTKTSKAVSPTSFEFSRAGTTDTAMTSGSDSATLRRRKRQLKNQNDDEDEGDDLDEEGDSGDFTERPEFEDSEELEPLFSDFAEGSEFEDYEEGPEFRDSGDDEDGDYEEDKSKNLSKVGRKWKGRSVPVDILEEKHTAQHKAAKPGLLHGRMCQDRYIPYWMPSEDLEETQKSRFEKLQKEYGGLHKEEYDSDVLDEEDPDFPRTAFVPDDPHNTRRSTNDRALLYYYHGELRNVWLELGLRRNITVKEDPQPPGLALKLLPFQKEGLHWMRVQEKSAYKGGILADEMGMGKTIQTLALIMTDPNAGPNLVVAPTVALMQWKSEIEKYTGDALKVYLFHGASRSTDHKELSKYNVILTSYNLVESVYRKQQTGYRRKNGIVKEDSGLHKVMYHRVILDEAHNIKDRTSNTAKAVFALKTKYKLCLSGTPLQNRIGELFSLLRFLEIDPFAYYYCRKCPCKQLQWKFSNNRSCDSCGCSPMSHISFFNYECLKPIQRDGNTGAGKIAYNNIRHLLKHIMLRRTKNEREDDLGLPNKVVRIRKDKFSEEELDLYDSIFSDGKRKFETYVSQGVVLNNYANIFTLITRMRQMADHPDLVLRKHIEDGQVTLVCGICDEEAEEAIKSKCHHTYCRDCVQRYVSGFCGNSAPECPKCHIPLVIDLAAPAIEPDSYQPKRTSIVNRIDMTNWRSSTKIEALCHELYRLRRPYQTTKSIVFSQFTSMLQLIEWRLNHAGFKTVMLQGSMSPAQRDATIKYFMTHVEVEVFLVSLKAGGVALNLIEANHVFLMEPWWNPSVEWQAADRIHRIGQTRVCTVTRMVVDDSIESRIIELQEKKTRMIEATVNADQKAMERLTADDMRFLFQN